jgi:nucleotide-binding universal stress UspA family protein
MILVGVDFAEGSRVALAHARVLSSASGLPVELLHVRGYGDREGWVPGAEELAWMVSAGVRSEDLHTREGVPWVELVRYARERGAAFIVAARRGRPGTQTSFLGSTAMRLATNSTDPVLLVTAAPKGGEVVV